MCQRWCSTRSTPVSGARRGWPSAVGSRSSPPPPRGSWSRTCRRSPASPTCMFGCARRMARRSPRCSTIERGRWSCRACLPGWRLPSTRSRMPRSCSTKPHGFARERRDDRRGVFFIPVSEVLGRCVATRRWRLLQSAPVVKDHTKYVFVTGGVASGLGKGITTASLGRLFSSRGLKVVLQKLDPYVNVDPGTMNPFEHGEVFVLDDGAETDLDLGHYERFLDAAL